MAENLELRINGARRAVETEPDRTLLSVLRDDLDLTAAKYGCGEGQCGACTVLVDGPPTRSCLLPENTAAGMKKVTLEGLEKDGALHPVQQAFLECDAMQCGYCIPGMILSGVALLASNPAPSEQEIVSGMASNLCRCCAYPRIAAAVRKAAKGAK